jgi:basic membrane protein A
MQKKTLAMLLCLIMGLSLLAGCGGANNGNAPAQPQEPAAGSQTAGIPKEDIKVGFVYIGSAHDGGYSQAHDRGRQEMVKNLGLREDQTIVVEDVIENADCEKTIRDLIDQGCNVIYANSFGHGEWVQKVAVDHPEVKFGHATGITMLDNMSTYMGRIYEARYLSGIAAGLKTKTNKIGYVAAMPIGEVVRGINAFTLGVRSVNPEATVEVVWINSWYDPALEKTTALTLLDKGCDVIAQHCDTTSPQVAAEEKGGFAIGYNSATYDAAPKAYMTAPLFNWGVWYTADVQSAIDGTWKAQRYWEGLNAGMVELDKLTENCAEGTQEAIDTAEAKIKDGSLVIFQGPIKDNKGNLAVKEGQIMTDAELESFNWFVEGVIGEVPSN